MIIVKVSAGLADVNGLLEVQISPSTNCRLVLIEPSAREVFIFWTLVEREEQGVSEERRRGYGSNLARLKQCQC